MTFRSLAVAAAAFFSSTTSLATSGCFLVDTQSCTDELVITSAEIVVIDRDTKTPICEATVRVALEGGAPTSASRVAATKDAPCSYRGGDVRDGSSGKAITYYVEKDGYQDALATGRVPSSADGCHIATPKQTIEINK